jgi:small subunit ribosomal protein S8
MQTDPIADFLTRIRNASRAGHEEVRIPSSKLTVEIVRILHSEGYIRGYQAVEGEGQKHLRVLLKYLDRSRQPILTGVKRISKPGRRVYVGKGNVPRVQGGLGIAILSTPRGILTDNRARKLGLGGELICSVW